MAFRETNDDAHVVRCSFSFSTRCRWSCLCKLVNTLAAVCNSGRDFSLQGVPVRIRAAEWVAILVSLRGDEGGQSSDGS